MDYEGRMGFVVDHDIVVTDMDTAYEELSGRGLELGEVQELGQPGRPGFKFVFFNDPDGNGWAVQEI